MWEINDQRPLVPVYPPLSIILPSYTLMVSLILYPLSSILYPPSSTTPSSILYPRLFHLLSYILESSIF